MQKNSPTAVKPKSKKAPRLYHTKSRTGCQRCRARRVKCDEARPVCQGCERHGVECMYGKEPVQKTNCRQGNIASGSADILATITSPSTIHRYSNGDQEIEFSETKSRRLMELKLLQNWMSSTSHTLAATHNDEVKNLWSVTISAMALQHESLLYGILALSAFQLLRAEPDNLDLYSARQRYLTLFFKTHGQAVGNLNAKNAEIVCFGSLIIFVDSFATLQDRNLDTYTPPLEWLGLARGASSVFNQAVTVGDYDMENVMIIVRSSPRLTDPTSLFAEINRASLLHVLRDVPGDQEVWDDETRDSYEKALSYIGTIEIAIKNGEHDKELCRRISAFAVLIPKRYVELIAEKRPRALVILAHFFAFCVDYKQIWWIGEHPRREIRGILKDLPLQWHDLMQWPMQAAGILPHE